MLVNELSMIEQEDEVKELLEESKEENLFNLTSSLKPHEKKINMNLLETEKYDLCLGN